MSLDPVLGSVLVTFITTAGGLVALYLKMGRHEARHRENDQAQNTHLDAIHSAVNGRLAEAHAEIQRLKMQLSAVAPPPV